MMTNEVLNFQVEEQLYWWKIHCPALKINGQV